MACSDPWDSWQLLAITIFWTKWELRKLLTSVCHTPALTAWNSASLQSYPTHAVGILSPLDQFHPLGLKSMVKFHVHLQTSYAQSNLIYIFNLCMHHQTLYKERITWSTWWLLVVEVFNYWIPTLWASHRSHAFYREEHYPTHYYWPISRAFFVQEKATW